MFALAVIIIAATSPIVYAIFRRYFAQQESMVLLAGTATMCMVVMYHFSLIEFSLFNTLVVIAEAVMGGMCVGYLTYIILNRK